MIQSAESRLLHHDELRREDFSTNVILQMRIREEDGLQKWSMREQNSK